MTPPSLPQLGSQVEITTRNEFANGEHIVITRVLTLTAPATSYLRDTQPSTPDAPRTVTEFPGHHCTFVADPFYGDTWRVLSP